MYPIGSIYISFTPINGCTYYPWTTNSDTFQQEWNGCIWEIINSDVFLRNATFEIKDVSEYVEPEDPYKYRFVLSGAGETGGEAEHTLTVDEMPSHSHSIHMDRCESAYGLGLYSNGNYYHSGNVAIMRDDWNTTVIDTGGNQPHNNLPPYLTVYMYKRIA